MKKALVVVLFFAMLCTACSTAWVSTLDSILAAAAPALVNILQIVAIANGRPLDSSLVAKINGDAIVIKTLAADFASSSSSSAAGVCEQLQSAIAVYRADQQLVLQAAQVGDANTQTKITLLVDLVTGTVDAITAVIPSCQATAQVLSVKANVPYNLSSFTDHYNSILIAKTGDRAVDSATPKLKLHKHSKIARVVTFGRLQ